MDVNDLGTVRFDWGRLKAVVTYLPSTSALARSMHGDQALWSTHDHLAALAVDALHAANWQRGGGKGKRPRPVPRPGEQDKGKKRFGTGRMSLDVARTFFDRVNRRTHRLAVGDVAAPSRGDVHP